VGSTNFQRKKQKLSKILKNKGSFHSNFSKFQKTPFLNHFNNLILHPKQLDFLQSTKVGFFLKNL
jgi:hypothetical protein